MKYLLFFLFAFVLGNCSREPLKVEKVLACGYFDSLGECKEPISEKKLYEISIPRASRMETWNALANHLYFKTKQTPGFVVYFNRKFSLEEKQIIRESYKAYYEFSESTGKVEGFEMGENWIGSFQYLGSILKDRQREKKEDKSYPVLNSIFPAQLIFRFTSDVFQGETSTEINLNLNYE